MTSREEKPKWIQARIRTGVCLYPISLSPRMKGNMAESNELWPGAGRPGTGWLLSLGLACSALSLCFLLCKRGVRSDACRSSCKGSHSTPWLTWGFRGGSSKQATLARLCLIAWRPPKSFPPPQGSSTGIMLSPFATEICFLEMSICVPIVF